MTVILGEKEVIARLKSLEDKLQRKIIKSSVGKALTVITKSIKGEVPAQWKQIKGLIGSRFAKRVGGQFVVGGKAGVGVGKAKAGGEKVRLSSGKTLTLRKQRGKRPGVGLGPENVHWFILGTKQRRQGTRTRGRGAKAKTIATGGKIRRTGRMPPQVPGIVQRGWARSESKAIGVMIESLRAGIDREVARMYSQIKGTGK